MWAGVTDGKTEQIADDFNSSIHFDSRMYKQDITGSMAHAAMLAAQGIISAADADTLIAGLEGKFQQVNLDIKLKNKRLVLKFVLYIMHLMKCQLSFIFMKNKILNN